MNLLQHNLSRRLAEVLLGLALATLCASHAEASVINWAAASEGAKVDCKSQGIVFGNCSDVIDGNGSTNYYMSTSGASGEIVAITYFKHVAASITKLEVAYTSTQCTGTNCPVEILTSSGWAIAGYLGIVSGGLHVATGPWSNVYAVRVRVYHATTTFHNIAEIRAFGNDTVPPTRVDWASTAAGAQVNCQGVLMSGNCDHVGDKNIGSGVSVTGSGTTSLGIVTYFPTVAATIDTVQVSFNAELGCTTTVCPVQLLTGSTWTTVGYLLNNKLSIASFTGTWNNVAAMRIYMSYAGVTSYFVGDMRAFGPATIATGYDTIKDWAKASSGATAACDNTPASGGCSAVVSNSGGGYVGGVNISGAAEVTATAYFRAIAPNITRIDAVYLSTACTGTTCPIEVLANGTWTNVGYAGTTGYSVASFSGSWNNVAAVRVRLAYAGASTHHIGRIRAYGADAAFTKYNWASAANGASAACAASPASGVCYHANDDDGTTGMVSTGASSSLGTVTYFDKVAASVDTLHVLYSSNAGCTGTLCPVHLLTNNTWTLAGYILNDVAKVAAFSGSWTNVAAVRTSMAYAGTSKQAVFDVYAYGTSTVASGYDNLKNWASSAEGAQVSCQYQGTPTGSCASVVDDASGSSYWVTSAGAADLTAVTMFEDLAPAISRIDVNYASTSCTSTNCPVEVLANGSWVNLGYLSTTTSSTASYSTGWANVRAVRVRLAYAGASTHHLFEIMAFGADAAPSGLKNWAAASEGATVSCSGASLSACSNANDGNGQTIALSAGTPSSASTVAYFDKVAASISRVEITHISTVGCTTTQCPVHVLTGNTWTLAGYILSDNTDVAAFSGSWTNVGAVRASISYAGASTSGIHEMYAWGPSTVASGFDNLKNWASSAEGATAMCTLAGTGSGGCSQINDEDATTSLGSTGTSTNVEVGTVVYFEDTAASISRVDVQYSTTACTGTNCPIEILTNGAWTNLAYVTTATEATIASFSGSWTNVAAVRVRLMYATTSTMKVSEISAYGADSSTGKKNWATAASGASASCFGTNLGGTCANAIDRNGNTSYYSNGGSTTLGVVSYFEKVAASIDTVQIGVTSTTGCTSTACPVQILQGSTWTTLGHVTSRSVDLVSFTGSWTNVGAIRIYMGYGASSAQVVAEMNAWGPDTVASGYENLKNWASSANGAIASCSWAGTQSGSCTNVNDGTGEVSWSMNGTPSQAAAVVSFADTATSITRVDVAYSSIGCASTACPIEILANGTWSNLGYALANTMAVASFTGTWANVTAVRLNLYYGSASSQQIAEIRAFGPDNATGKKNWAALTNGASASCSGVNTFGACSDAIDAAGPTSWMSSGASTSLGVTTLFDKVAATIESARVTFSSTNGCTTTQCPVQLLVGSTWTTIGYVISDLADVASFNGSWSNVGGIRVTMAYGASSVQQVFDMRAIGPSTIAAGYDNLKNWAAQSEGGLASCGALGTGGGSCLDLNDGNGGTSFWASGSSSEVAGIVYFADIAPTINRINISYDSIGCAGSCPIEVLSGGTWALLGNATASTATTATYTGSWTNVTAVRAKLSYGATSTQRISEIAAWGPAGSSGKKNWALDANGATTSCSGSPANGYCPGVAEPSNAAWVSSGSSSLLGAVVYFEKVAATIDRVEVIFTSLGGGCSTTQCPVQLLVGSTWQTVGYAVANHAYVSAATGSWSNVAAMRVQMSYGAASTQVVYGMMAYGPATVATGYENLKNWAKASEGGTPTCYGNGTVTGTCIDVNDGNGNAAFYATSNPTDLAGSVLFDDIAPSITRVDVEYNATNCAASCPIEILANGTWTLLGNMVSNQATVASYTGSWTNVTAVRARLTYGASATVGIAEIRAFGPDGSSGKKNWALASNNATTACSATNMTGSCGAANDGLGYSGPVSSGSTSTLGVTAYFEKVAAQIDHIQFSFTSSGGCTTTQCPVQVLQGSTWTTVGYIISDLTDVASFNGTWTNVAAVRAAMSYGTASTQVFYEVNAYGPSTVASGYDNLKNWAAATNGAQPICYGQGTISGGCASAVDGTLATKISTTSSSAVAELALTSYFADTAASITRVDVAADATNCTASSCPIEILTNGSWTHLAHLVAPVTSTVASFTGSWTNVTAVRVRLHYGATATLGISEISAFGPDNAPSGKKDWARASNNATASCYGSNFGGACSYLNDHLGATSAYSQGATTALGAVATFEKVAATIDTVHVLYTSTAGCTTTLCPVQLLTGSSWTTIGYVLSDTADVAAFSGSWSNVGGVRVSMGYGASSTQSLFELVALGPSTVASGYENLKNWASAAEGGTPSCYVQTPQTGSGACADVNDGTGASSYLTTTSSTASEVTAVVRFADIAPSITRVDVNVASTNCNGSTCPVEILAGGTWTNLGYVGISNGTTASYTGSWSNVAAVRVKLVYGAASTHQISEISAYGPTGASGKRDWARQSNGASAACSGTNSGPMGICDSVIDDSGITNVVSTGGSSSLSSTVFFETVAASIDSVYATVSSDGCASTACPIQILANDSWTTIGYVLADHAKTFAITGSWTNVSAVRVQTSYASTSSQYHYGISALGPSTVATGFSGLRNWAAASEGAIATCDHTMATSDPCANVNDGNGGSRILTSSAGTSELVAVTAFDDTASLIKRVEVAYSSTACTSTNCPIQLLVNGVWTTLGYATTSAATTVTYSGSWANVTAARVRLSSTTNSDFAVYEIRVFGPTNAPSGKFNYAASANGAFVSCGGTSVTGFCSYTNDHDGETNVTSSNATPAVGAVAVFDRPAATLDNIQIAYTATNCTLCQVRILQGTTWTLLGSLSTGYAGLASFVGPWTNVSAVRVEMNYAATGTESIFEISAYGPENLPLFVDIGLRFYDGSSTQTMAVEPQGVLTSPLRIRKGTVTYGVILVDPTDPDASPMRVKTATGGIKAVRYYTP